MKHEIFSGNTATLISKFLINKSIKKFAFTDKKYLLTAKI